MRQAKLVVFAVLAMFVTMLAQPASGANITPDLVGPGWVVDRYAPDTFGNVGPYQGRNDVLGVGISENGGHGNRGGQNSTFYATQGMKQSVSGGVGSLVSADLFIPLEWESEANGSRRTDIWASMTDGSSIVAYSILGFTNYNGTAAPGTGYVRAYDGNTPNGWVDSTAAVNYGAWNSFAIEFTGSTFDYFFNGSLIYSDSTIGGATGFTEFMVQAYNFNGPDPAFVGAVAGSNLGNYTAHWSNTQSVPEPTSMVMLGLGLLGAGVARRRRSAS
jgi:hypothetical protein